MPLDIDTTKPGDNDLISAFPSDARKTRTTIEDMFAVEHESPGEFRHQFADSAPGDAVVGSIYHENTNGKRDLFYRRQGAGASAEWSMLSSAGGVLGVGTASQRDAAWPTPVQGWTWFNTDTGQVEVYDATRSGWRSAAQETLIPDEEFHAYLSADLDLDSGTSFPLYVQPISFDTIEYESSSGLYAAPEIIVPSGISWVQATVGIRMSREDVPPRNFPGTNEVAIRLDHRTGAGSYPTYSTSGSGTYPQGGLPGAGGYFDHVYLSDLDPNRGLRAPASAFTTGRMRVAAADRMRVIALLGISARFKAIQTFLHVKFWS